jgi:hypothetical protein
MARYWSREPAKLWLSFMVLLSAHHFVMYSRQVTVELAQACQAHQGSERDREAMEMLS